MDLASKVIQANEEERIEQEVVQKRVTDGAPEGYYTDDLGFWVEQDIRRKEMRYAEYLLFRCRYLNPNIHTREGGFLYAGHTLIFPTSASIANLADIPSRLPTTIVVWIHKRLSRESPKLDGSKIEVCPGLLWDFNKQELVELPKKSYKTI